MASNATEPLYFELCVGLDNLAKCSSAMTIVPKTSPAAIWRRLVTGCRASPVITATTRRGPMRSATMSTEVKGKA